MNKKPAVVVTTLLVVGVVIVGVVLILHVPGGVESPAAQNSSVGQNPSVDLKQLPQQTQSIIQSGDAAKCISLNVITDGVNYETVCRNNIVWNAAQASLDIKACDGLDNKLMSIADCQSSVVAKLVAKDKNLTVCDQFAGTLKNLCVNDYWSILAVSENDPGQCIHLVASSSEASMNCEENVLVSSIAGITSTPKCSLFTGAAKKDCTNYNNGNCQALVFPPLQQSCLQKGK
jgi:hypothetical protein